MALNQKKHFVKKFKKFNNNKDSKNKRPKYKVKQHIREDEEIEKIKQEYEKIPDWREIKSFEDFPLSSLTRKGLKDNKFKVPTEIQKQGIGPALLGKDILGAAITGSGKTLAFLIPVLENLFLKKWTRMDGVGSIIISPTRELAYQIFETLKKVGAHHDLSSGLIIGGKNLKFERNRMDQCNIIICTPGRLLQHMDENPLFNCSSMNILVLDEADRCLDLGFSATMNGIIENLPPDRQTLLFSATQTSSVKDLARLSLKSPVYIAPHEKATSSTPTSLQQNYVIVNQEDKITMLWSFIKSHLKQKSIVFLSSCKQVKYTYEIFSKLRPGISLLALYGTLHQERRMAIYDEFCKRSKVVLFCTDIASRGLDFPTVSWVIQLDCPEDATAYIHRAGRTARHKAHGESLLVLTPSEAPQMLEELNAAKIPINQISIDPKKLFSPRVKMEAYLAQNLELKETAQRAFVAYIKSIYLMKNKKIFSADSIDFDEYARSLGLVVTPRVRFLQRIEKRKTKIDQNNENEDCEKMKSIDLNSYMGFDDSDDDEKDFVKIKRKNHDIDEGSDDDLELPNVIDRKEKLITKAALAKKIIKKKIISNKKIQFDEEGKTLVNTAKELQSELAKEYTEADDGGIDIEKARELMYAEDRFDRQRFKELVKQRHKVTKDKLKKKKKAKNEDENVEEEEEDYDFESGSEPDLSWLPKYDDETNEDIPVEHSDEKEKPSKKLSKKRKAKESIDEESVVKKKKEKRIVTSELNDTEALAMCLLNLK